MVGQLVDEWQRLPASWDVVRRSVDADGRPGRFLLTGSATPTRHPTHSGAGRIVRLRMRPLTLAERGVGIPTVSLAGLLGGDRPALSGTTAIRLDTYVAEILTGGFPGMRNPIPRSWRAAIDGYLDNIVEVDLPEVGIEVRHPGTLRRWMTAYAAATATATAYDRIRDAATAGESQKPAKTTTIAYREALERVWLLEPLEAKLSETVDDHDVAHLRWLQRRLGGQLLDAVVVTTGRHAYRRRDGIGVVPLSLLDP